MTSTHRGAEPEQTAENTTMNTTLLFLRSTLSKEKFEQALAWVKAQEKRIYLPDEKLWVFDTGTTPDDPSWIRIREEVEEAGWHIAGETLWDVNDEFRDNLPKLRGLAESAVERFRGVAR